MTDVQIVEKKKRGRKPLTEEERIQHRIIYNEKAKEYYRTIYGPKRDKTKKIICACGKEVLEANAARHRKSIKCIDKIKAINQLNNDDN